MNFDAHQFECHNKLISKDSPLRNKFLAWPDWKGWLTIIAALAVGAWGGVKLATPTVLKFQTVTDTTYRLDCRVTRLEAEREQMLAYSKEAADNTRKILDAVAKPGRGLR